MCVREEILRNMKGSGTPEEPDVLLPKADSSQEKKCVIEAKGNDSEEVSASWASMILIKLETVKLGMIERVMRLESITLTTLRTRRTTN
jgi:hypothetical protein